MSLLMMALACNAPEAPQAPAPPSDMAVTKNRALGWLEAYEGPVRFDAAIGAARTWEIEQADRWKALRDKRRAQVPDDDHPHNRLIDPTFRAAPDGLPPWSIPEPGGRRVNPNRVLTSALFCAESGWDPAVEDYACGAMRDDGGYHSVHGLWALTIARDNGCTKASCIPELVSEMVAHQPKEWSPERTLDIDLYGERLLTACMAGCPPEADAWATTLATHQQPDGSWGIDAPDEDPYYRYHATMVAAWGLALWGSTK